MFPELTNIFRLFEFYLQLTYNYNECIFIIEFPTEYCIRFCFLNKPLCQACLGFLVRRGDLQNPVNKK